MALTHAHIRSRITRIFNKWRPIMGLDAWLLTLRFDETEALGTCAAKPNYEEATINFNLPRIKRELPHTMYALEELVVHELTHCIIWRANETAVSRVARAILRARDSA